MRIYKYTSDEIESFLKIYAHNPKKKDFVNKVMEVYKNSTEEEFTTIWQCFEMAIHRSVDFLNGKYDQE